MTAVGVPRRYEGAVDHRHIGHLLHLDAADQSGHGQLDRHTRRLAVVAHAANAVLTFVALCAAVAAILVDRGDRTSSAG